MFVWDGYYENVMVPCSRSISTQSMLKCNKVLRDFVYNCTGAKLEIQTSKSKANTLLLLFVDHP